jgi:hypothetical protein
LEAIAIRHRDSPRKIEKDVFALVGRESDSPAMARFEIEGQRAGAFFLRPAPGGAMN